MKYITLEEVCENRTSNISQKDLKENEGIYPIYGASGLIKKVNFYTQDKEYIGIVKDGAGVGRIMLLPSKSSVIGTMQYIIPNGILDTKYLYYALISKNLSKYSSGATIPHIYFKDYKKEKIALISESEQKKVINILDRIIDIINKKKNQINLLEELVKSRFIEMFLENKKYPIMTLEELTGNKKENLVRGPFGGSLKKDDFIETGYLVYEQKHAIHNDFNYKKYYISKEKYQKMIRFKVESGDLIVSCSGTLGKIAEIPKEYKEGIINQALLKIKLDKNIINNKFFMVLFRMKYNEKELQRVSLGSGISNFPSMKEVRNFDFIVPPLSLQNEFASFVTKTNKLKFEAEKSLKEMENLYESLMQKFFKQN